MKSQGYGVSDPGHRRLVGRLCESPWIFVAYEWRWNDDYNFSHYSLFNDKHSESGGTWQLWLQGKFKVREIAVIVRNRAQYDDDSRYRGLMTTDMIDGQIAGMLVVMTRDRRDQDLR